MLENHLLYFPQQISYIIYNKGRLINDLVGASKILNCCSLAELMKIHSDIQTILQNQQNG